MKFPSASNITKLLLARSTTTTCSVCGLNTIADGLKVLRIFLCGLINRVGWTVRDLKLVSQITFGSNGWQKESVPLQYTKIIKRVCISPASIKRANLFTMY